MKKPAVIKFTAGRNSQGHIIFHNMFFVSCQSDIHNEYTYGK